MAVDVAESGGHAVVWLDVPFAEKDAAKLLGARWDGQRRRWFTTSANAERCERWLARPAIPEVLPGEDRTFGPGLFIDLVPQSCWFTNVRSCVDSADWDRLRRMVYARADHTCEACGAVPDRANGVYLEAHERWLYDEVTHVQALRRLISLCTPCHTATHYGYATVRGLDGQARAHLGAVNRWSQNEVDRHIEAMSALWRRRNAVDWTLDLTMLTGAGVKIKAPPDAVDRRRVSARQLPTTRTWRRM